MMSLCCAESERLTEQQAEDLMAWMRNSLGQKVTNIKVTTLTHAAFISESLSVHYINTHLRKLMFSLARACLVNNVRYVCSCR